MGEPSKGEKQEELKELKQETTSFEGNLPISGLFDKKVQEAIKKEVGSELMIPMIGFAYGKEKGKEKLVFIFYTDRENYEGGKCLLLSNKPENVKELYGILTRILIPSKE